MQRNGPVSRIEVKLIRAEFLVTATGKTNAGRVR